MKTREELFQMAEEFYYASKGVKNIGHLTLRDWIESVEFTFGGQS